MADNNYEIVPGHISREEALFAEGTGDLYHVQRLAWRWEWTGETFVPKPV